MSYQVNITDNAEKELYQIYFYIEKVLFAPKAAENLYNDIMKTIYSLQEMPERYREYNKEQYPNKNLRIVAVKNYDIFYIVYNEKKQVDIIKIAYAPSDLENTQIIQ